MQLHNVQWSTRAETVDDYDAIDVRADPNGLAFDRHTCALYIADSTTGSILCAYGPQQRRISTIEAGGAMGTQRIGGLAVTPYGSLFVTRPGYGHAGAIFRVDADGHTEALEKLPPQFWRLGCTYDPHEHALYTTQFLTSRFGAHEGAVVVVDLVSGEPSMVLDGFLKPIGIAKLGSTLVVADARQRAVFRVELVAGRAVSRIQLVADVGRPDSVCACGPDSVLLTSYDEEMQRGAVRQLWLDGRTRGIASGPWEPRGVVTDGERCYVSARQDAKILVFPL